VLAWNRVPAGELAVPRASLNRHAFVCGATGAGKSQTVRGLLEAATRAGIGWLVVEPAKAEYRLMAAWLPGTEVIRIRPGELGDPPAGINPLEPAPGPGWLPVSAAGTRRSRSVPVPGRPRGQRTLSSGPGRGLDPVL